LIEFIAWLSLADQIGVSHLVKTLVAAYTTENPITGSIRWLGAMSFSAPSGESVETEGKKLTVGDRQFYF